MMWLKMVFVLLFLIAVEAGPVPLPADSEFKDVSKLLIGKAIHLHWLYQRGFWWAVGGTDNDQLQIKQSSESKIYFYDWSRFKVVDCDGGFVCIKSLLGDDRYMKFPQAPWDLYVEFEFVGYPKDRGEFKYQIECTNEKFEICRIKNAVFGFYVTGYKDDINTLFIGDQETTEHDLFEIKTPLAHCQMDLVRAISNESPVKMAEEVSVKEGISSSLSDKFSLSIGLRAEISGGFAGVEASVGTSIDTAMEQSSSTTTASETTRKTTYTIPPYSRIDIKQRVGVYGPFKIKTSATVAICTDIKSIPNQPCAIRDAKLKMKKMKKTEKTDKTE